MKIPWGVLAGMGLLAGGMRNPDSFNTSAGILSGAVDRRRRERAAALAQQQDMARRERERQDEIAWRDTQARRWDEDRTARGEAANLTARIREMTQTGIDPVTGQPVKYAPGGMFASRVNQDVNRDRGNDIRAGTELGRIALTLHDRFGGVEGLNQLAGVKGLLTGQPSTWDFPESREGILGLGGAFAQRNANTEGQEWRNRLLGAEYDVKSDPAYIASMVKAPGLQNNLRYYQGLNTQSQTRERDTLLPERVKRTRAETHFLNMRPGFENRRLGVAEGTLNLNKRRMFYQVPGMLGLEPAPGSTYTVDGETLQPFPAEGLTFVPRGTGAANRKAETVKGPPIGTEGVPAAIAKQLDSAGINPDVPGRYRQKSFQWWKKNAPGLLATDLKGNVRLNMDSPDYERFQQDQSALDQQYAGMVEEAIRDFGNPANDGLTWEAVLKSDEYLSMSDADRRRVRQAFAASMKNRKKR